MKYLLLAFLFCVPAFGGSLTANVEKTDFESGEEVTLSVEVEGSLDGELTIADSSDFDIGGRSQSTQVQIINGKYSKTSTYIYSLNPKKNGTLLTPIVTATVDGKSEKTLAIKISVGTGSASGKNSQAAGGDLYQLERTIAPGPYYKHMPIVETIRILRRMDWQSANKVPVSSPDWQIYEVKGEEPSSEVRGGITYGVTTLRRVLVPLKAGNVKLPDWTVQIEFIDIAKRRSGSPFDIFSGASMARRVLNVDKKEVAVLPSSESDIPVGALSPTVNLSKLSVNVGDSVTLEFKVAGLAWFSGLKLDSPELVGRFKLYRDQPVTQEEASKSGLHGEKSLKVSIVPSEAGRLEFSPWVFRFFDPSVGKIVEKSVAIPAIEVSGSSESLISSGSVTPPSTQAKDNLTNTQASFYSGPPAGFSFKGGRRELIFWLFSFAALLIVAALGILFFQLLQARRIPEYAEMMRAWKNLRSQLGKASSLDSRIRAFRRYASVKLQASEAAVTVGDVIRVLESDQWENHAVSEVSRAFAIAEAEKFSGVSQSLDFPLSEAAQEVKRKKPCFK